MRNISKSLKIILSVIFLNCIAALPAISGESGPWKAARVAGEVWVQQQSADWRQLAVGDSVSVGHRLRTGHDGEVILARDEERVTVTPNSVLHVEPGGSGIVTRLFQKAGTMMFKVRKKARSHFEVRTPFLVAVVKGTQFTVSVHEQGGTVHVTEGLVEVADIGAQSKVMVHPGKTASIAATKGSKVQLGTTPPAKATPKDKGVQKGVGKQSHAPTLMQPIGIAKVNISARSKGLLKRRGSPADRQLSARATDAGAASVSAGKGPAAGNPFDKSASAGLGNAFGRGGGPGGELGGGRGSGNNGGNNGGGGVAGGVGKALGLGNGNGKANGNGLGLGLGKGNGKGLGLGL